MSYQKRNVTVEVWEKDNPNHATPSCTIKGRLIGVLSGPEAAMVLKDWDKPGKIFTMPSINLSDAILGLESVFTKDKLGNYGHVVIAATQFGAESSYAKRLFISGQIKTLGTTEKTDNPNKTGAALLSQELDLEDGSIIKIKETV